MCNPVRSVHRSHRLKGRRPNGKAVRWSRMRVDVQRDRPPPGLRCPSPGSLCTCGSLSENSCGCKEGGPEGPLLTDRVFPLAQFADQADFFDSSTLDDKDGYVLGLDL